MPERSLNAKIDAGLKKDFEKACTDRDVSLKDATSEALRLWLERASSASEDTGIKSHESALESFNAGEPMDTKLRKAARNLMKIWGSPDRKLREWISGNLEVFARAADANPQVQNEGKSPIDASSAAGGQPRKDAGTHEAIGRGTQHSEQVEKEREDAERRSQEPGPRRSGPPPGKSGIA